MSQLSELGRVFARMTGDQLLEHGGKVVSVNPAQARLVGLGKTVRIGDLVEIENSGLAEVIQFDSDCAVVSPIDDFLRCRIDAAVFKWLPPSMQMDASVLGRVFDGLGRPIDGFSQVGEHSRDIAEVPFKNEEILNRNRVSEPLRTGVRVIDVFTPLCFGQRIGIFSGSGVGKSTLLSMLARSDSFDVVVIALVGERTREVREFLEDSIGEAERLKTVAFVAASNESAIMRRRAPELAVEVANRFGRQGNRVLLLMDSVTRYAHALREIGISRNEPPVARGYPPSVFAELPKLMEQTGPAATGDGSVTAIVTVLVDGDDHNDPASDAMRGILDGHLILDRTIAAQGRYPPVDPVGSISRMADRAWSPDERKLALELRKLISHFEETRDLRMLGGWRPGNDPQLDKAVRVVPALYEALCQLPEVKASDSAFDELVPLLKEHLKNENQQQENIGQKTQADTMAATQNI